MCKSKHIIICEPRVPCYPITNIDKQITITIFVLLLNENDICLWIMLIMFVFFLSFLFFFKFFNPPPQFVLYVSYIVQNPYHINDTDWISYCFSIVTIHVLFNYFVLCMYLTSFLIMHCIYLFIFSLGLRCCVYLFTIC